MAHITQEQRYVISAMLSAGETQAKIAQYLNKSQAAISKELKRNSTVIYGKRKKYMIYQPRKAQERSDVRKEFIQQIQDRINNRPRKRLNFEKPAELFNAHFNNFNT